LTLVGVLGGGQLGRMLGLAGIPLGLRFRFLDPSADAPAGAVGELVVAPYDEAHRLADADVVTYEFENVPVAAVRGLAHVQPPPAALEAAQDRLAEKTLFRRLGIPTVEFERPPVPALAKTRRLGYDGKGQRRIQSLDELREDELAEEIVELERELSLLAVRGRGGETAFYPLVENVHRDGILRTSRAPAAPERQAEAEEYGRRILDELGYVGVLALELFDTGKALLANELAPRVHNSGHWTIEGAATSQFENHLRAILGLPLGPTHALGGAAMANLIGELPPLEELLRVPGAHVHLYGKAPRPGRKLGHVTLVDAVPEAVEAVERLAARS
jgi:5-(carboxyamino)imidazole ribonucleotide synthase